MTSKWYLSVFYKWLAIGGFLISGIHAQVNTGTNIGTIELLVRSERPIELLVDQINKLIDIKEVKVDNSAPQQCIA